MPLPSPNNRIGIVLSRLDGIKVMGDGWVSRCPAHDDSTPSMTINLGGDGRILVCCQAGCGFEAICQAMGLEASDFFPPSETVPKPTQATRGDRPYTLDEMRAWKSTRAIYDYHDENGTSLYAVRRYVEDDGKKTFRQYRAVNGRYVSGMAKTRRVLYRLPELIAAVAAGRTIWVVEGEKDVESLRAICIDATCNVGGAKKWPKHVEPFFRGANVVICQDNDEPGVEHAQMVAAALAPVAASVRILRLPNLPAHGDVSDWLEAGGTRDELLQLADAATTHQTAKSADAEDYHLTDWGNAQRLVAMHGDRIRYCRPAKSWLVWDGKRWERDRVGRIEQLCKATVHQMYLDATSSGSTDRRQVEWALKSEAHGRLVAMDKTATSEPGIAVVPEQLDADPWVLNCLNGTLDLRTGRLMPHDRRQLITKVIPVAYDSSATCPLWESTLHRLMGDDEGMVAYLRRVLGYSLSGITRENAMFIAYGTGANGKSTILNMFRDLMGDYATQAQFTTFEVQKEGRPRDDVADLKGARFVCASEGERGARLAESLVKSLTGGDAVKARFLYQDLFEFVPQFKLMLASNHKPTIRGTDNGIWRRIRLIPFMVTIPEAQRDKQLPERLRPEWPGILAWAVRGCLEWQRIGLADPPQVLAATEDYREEMDRLGPFFTDVCQMGPDLWAYADRLYQSYARWAKDQQDEVLSAQQFAKRLRERDCKPFRKVENNKPRRAWSGIALREEEQPHRPQPPAQSTIWNQDQAPALLPTHWTDTYLA